MGQIFVRSHKRGGSLIKAYARLGHAIKSVENRAYRSNKKTIRMDRMNQYYKILRGLETKREHVRDVLGAKFSTGGAILRGKRKASSFSMSSLSRKYR